MTEISEERVNFCCCNYEINLWRSSWQQDGPIRRENESAIMRRSQPSLTQNGPLSRKSELGMTYNEHSTKQIEPIKTHYEDIKGQHIHFTIEEPDLNRKRRDDNPPNSHDQFTRVYEASAMTPDSKRCAPDKFTIHPNKISVRYELNTNYTDGNVIIADQQPTAPDETPENFSLWNDRFVNYEHEWKSVNWKQIYDRYYSSSCDSDVTSSSEYESADVDVASNGSVDVDEASNGSVGVDEASNRSADGHDNFFECISSRHSIENSNDVHILSDKSSTGRLLSDFDNSDKQRQEVIVNQHVILSIQRKPTGKPRFKAVGTTASICLDLCSYELVGNIARRFGMKVVDHNSLWDVLWSDPCIGIDTHQRMKRFQRTNHFPLITELCRKNLLAKNLNEMRAHFPADYDFFPKTWILPRENHEVQMHLRAKRGTVIVKPDNGSNGLGISLIRNLRHMTQEPNRSYICQQYIANPFLIDGYKFDIRVYTLITSCDPMRLYAHREGVVRFATVKYEKPAPGNLTNSFMHLTNYSVNKHSISFIHDDEIGSKRRISTMNEWFERNSYDVNAIWSRIDDVIVKTVLSAYPNMKSMYNSVFTKRNYTTACFQLLGFDILLDEHLKPYVLEVNHSPSFYTDTKIDLEIKEQVLCDTFRLCNLTKSVKRKVLAEERVQAQDRLLRRKAKCSDREEELRCAYKEAQWSWERKHSGNFRMLYPCVDGDKYESLCLSVQTPSYYKETFASNIRTAIGRTQRMDVELKKKNRLAKNLGGTKNKEQSWKNKDQDNTSSVKKSENSQLLEKIYGRKIKKTVEKMPQNRSDLFVKKCAIIKKEVSATIIGDKKDVERHKINAIKRNKENIGRNRIEKHKVVKKVISKSTAKPAAAKTCVIVKGNFMNSQVKVSKANAIRAGRQIGPEKSVAIVKPFLRKNVSVENNGGHVGDEAEVDKKLDVANSGGKKAKPTNRMEPEKVNSDNKQIARSIVDPHDVYNDQTDVEENLRLAELALRKSLIESTGLKKAIYMSFKKRNNLSNGDLMLYRHLEVKAK